MCCTILPDLLGTAQSVSWPVQGELDDLISFRDIADKEYCYSIVTVSTYTGYFVGVCLGKTL